MDQPTRVHGVARTREDHGSAHARSFGAAFAPETGNPPARTKTPPAQQDRECFVRTDLVGVAVMVTVAVVGRLFRLVDDRRLSSARCTTDGEACALLITRFSRVTVLTYRCRLR